MNKQECEVCKRQIGVKKDGTLFSHNCTPSIEAVSDRETGEVQADFSEPSEEIETEPEQDPEPDLETVSKTYKHLTRLCGDVYRRQADLDDLRAEVEKQGREIAGKESETEKVKGKWTYITYAYPVV